MSLSVKSLNLSKNPWFIAGAVGLVSAMVITSVFHLHSNDDNTVIFGGKTATVIYAVILCITVFGIMLMVWFSVVVRDLKFPREHPIRFTIETLASGVIPSVFIFLLYYLRDKPITRYTFQGFVLLSLKIMLVHILFQFSGVYSSFFR